MENIFIVLAIVASVIYKFYTNYKEEMEKAAKRKQQAPPVPQGPVPIPQQDPRQSRPIPPPPSTPRSPNTYTPEIRKPVERRPPMTRPAIPISKEIPDEVSQAQRLRAEREQKKALELVVEEEISPVAEQEFEFDLRTAVIQSAILDRPYQ